MGSWLQGRKLCSHKRSLGGTYRPPPSIQACSDKAALFEWTDISDHTRGNKMERTLNIKTNNKNLKTPKNKTGLETFMTTTGAKEDMNRLKERKA